MEDKASKRRQLVGTEALDAHEKEMFLKVQLSPSIGDLNFECGIVMYNKRGSTTINPMLE